MSDPARRSLGANNTVRLTVAQALVRFLGHQWSERDGESRPLFAGMFGIFGHGNVAGVGQALLQEELQRAARHGASADGAPPDGEAGLHALLGTGMPYVLARNEQAMVHTAVAYAKQQDRLQTWACTASVGPGSTNMLTGAALATINRIPVLLLPSSTFATRSASPLLQELEHPSSGDATVNDAFRPLSRYYDEVRRPEQLPSIALAAMRVLTDPAETGAVTISLPQDVQAEAFDWPVDLFVDRVWHVPRTPPESARIDEAAAIIAGAKRPLIVAGGGVHYSGAEDALAAFAARTGIPVGETQAGKGSLLHGHPQLVGAVGSTGTTAANALAREADVVIGIGTRFQDFTTASRTAFQDPDVTFVNLNVAGSDATKLSGLSVIGDARESIEALDAALGSFQADPRYRQQQAELWEAWDSAVEASHHPPAEITDALAPGLLTQGAVLGMVNELSDPRDVVLCAAGSMPGDLHKTWRVRDRRGYHVEYGYSCMGYEIPAAIGIRLADPTRDVFAMVGDGGYLMMPTELVTAVAEGVKIIVVLVQNHGFHSIGSLSESLGSQRFGTSYQARGEAGRLDGGPLPIDLAANAASLGASVIEVADEEGFAAAVAQAKVHQGGPVVIHVQTDPLVFAPDSDSWWEVPVSEVSELESTRQARAEYATHKATQRSHSRPSGRFGDPPSGEGGAP